jgi:MoaA/NifB/PqqE/SkfB family radical SAM enzyme
MCHQWGENGWNLTSEGKSFLGHNLDLERLIELFKEIRNQKREFDLLLTGGETFLYPKIKELLERSPNYVSFIEIITNGTFLRKYVDFFKNRKKIGIIVSIDGPPNIHNEIRGVKNIFETACSGMEMLIDYKKKTNSIYPLIEINHTLSEYNYQNFWDFISTLEDRFIKNGIEMNYHQLNKDAVETYKPNSMFLNISPRWFVNKEDGLEYQKQIKKYLGCDISSKWKSLVIEKNGLESIANEINNICHKFYEDKNLDYSNIIDMREYYLNRKNVFGHTRCLSAWESLVIQPDGNCYFCSDFPDYSLGNLGNDSFDNIWIGKRAQKFREVLKKQLLPVCHRCCNLV